MKNLFEFLNVHYDNAIEIKEKFKITEKKEWNNIITLLELNVQVGHLFNVKNHNKIYDEKDRNISNLGDELSDVLLQLCYLLHLEKVDLRKLSKYNCDIYNINILPILIGQLTEAIMEKEDYRYRKVRVGFNNINDFIDDRLFKIIIIIYNYATEEGYNMINEFSMMQKDACRFLSDYATANL